VDDRRAALVGTAADVVRGLTGDKPARVTRLRGGVMNDKYLVESTGATRYVVRFYSKANTAALCYEPDLVAKLRREGLPVARVIGDSRSGPGAPLPYMAYEYLPGTSFKSRLSISTVPTRRRVARQLAEFLFSMGSLPVAGYGELADSQSGHFDSWAEFMETSLSEGIASAARHGTLPLEMIHQVDLIRASLERFDPPEKPTLAWGDILINNLLIDNQGSLAGVVDFEGTLAAEYALNLGYCRAAYGLSAQFSRYLLEASERKLEPCDLDRLNLYTVLRGVRVARFAHLPLPTGHRRRSVLALFPGVRPAAQALAARVGGRALGQGSRD
jgi:aminoglycoside phosphotransferase (APT) family kinase protein